MIAHEPVCWQNQSPRSARFDDIYRTRYGALAQSQSVFLTGCALPARWHGQETFTVLETGFGMGLNFLTTWAAWLSDPQRSRKLNYIAIEAYPVPLDDLLRSAQAVATDAPAADPVAHGIATLAQQLGTCWADLHAGQNRWQLADGSVTLDLYVGDVQVMLQQVTDTADAVYLDGFSPANNPDMWSEHTLQWVARHCHAGTRLATYTVAGAVRRRLMALGFAVKKMPGLPPKRERLEAVMQAQATPALRHANALTALA